jgi:phosphatidylglycerophosphate synthase
VTELPPFTDFVRRRFAAPGPFWSWMIFERVGGALAYGFARLRVAPSSVTLMGGACGVGGAVALGVASAPAHVAEALALLLISYSLDCADGQLARATRRASPQGAWMDVAVDAVVIAFVTAALTHALLDDSGPFLSLLLGGTYGASRTASLFTSTLVRRDEGGMRLSGLLSRLRTAFTAAIDTPFVYVAVCAARLTPYALEAVIAAVSIMTAVQTLVSARHHFGSRPLPR